MTQDSNEKEVREVIEQWAAAIRDGNMEKILANHTSDIVMFDVPPPLKINGMEEYKKTWDLFYQYSPKSEGSFNLSDLTITASDTVAFAHAILTIVGSKARLTIGLRKEDGQWCIAHEHHSYPLAN
jgi:uncharacterized protein (TIGR02246 family)